MFEMILAFHCFTLCSFGGGRGGWRGDRLNFLASTEWRYLCLARDVEPRGQCIGVGNFQIIYGVSSYLVAEFKSFLEAVLIFFYG